MSGGVARARGRVAWLMGRGLVTGGPGVGVARTMAKARGFTAKATATLGVWARAHGARGATLGGGGGAGVRLWIQVVQN